MSLLRNRIPIDYESKEFSVSGGTTDYNFKTQQSAFATEPIVDQAVIRSDKEITVKMNNTSNDSTTVKAEIDSEFNEQISNIYITYSAGATISANIKIRTPIYG